MDCFPFFISSTLPPTLRFLKNRAFSKYLVLPSHSRWEWRYKHLERRMKSNVPTSHHVSIICQATPPMHALEVIPWKAISMLLILNNRSIRQILVLLDNQHWLLVRVDCIFLLNLQFIINNVGLNKQIKLLFKVLNVRIVQLQGSTTLPSPPIGNHTSLD